MGFFELCVHQCTQISDWLRVPKRQSNVNLYLSSFPGEKRCFHTQIRKMKNVCIEESLDSLNIHSESRKNIQNEEQERAVKELISGNNVSSLHDFEILRFVTYVRLPFSVGSLELFVTSLMFMNCTSCCVIRRNLKQSRTVRSCYGKF